MAKILIVEDNRDISAVVEDSLSMEHHTVEVAQDGHTGRALLRVSNYDLIILDWVLPDMTGLEICSSYRANGGETPILFLTGKSAIVEKEIAFNAGSDDYLTKPFHVRELLARVRALLRRPKVIQEELLQFRDITLDPKLHKVSKNGKEFKLFPKDFALLEFFMRHPNQIFSAEKLLDSVWPSDASASPDTVRQCLMRLRRQLSDKDDLLIKNVHGVGYKLEP